MSKKTNIFYNTFTHATELTANKPYGVTHEEFKKCRQLFFNRTGRDLTCVTLDAEKGMYQMFTSGYITMDKWDAYNAYLAGVVDTMRSY